MDPTRETPPDGKQAETDTRAEALRNVQGTPPPQGPTPLMPQPTKEPRGIHPGVKLAVIVLTVLLLLWAVTT